MQGFRVCDSADRMMVDYVRERCRLNYDMVCGGVLTELYLHLEGVCTLPLLSVVLVPCKLGSGEVPNVSRGSYLCSITSAYVTLEFALASSF